MLEQAEIEMMEMQKQNSNITNIHTRQREQQDRNEPKRQPLEMLLSVQIYHCLTGCFFNWASPEFGKCWPVSNQFQKNVRVPDWPPLKIKKSLSA